VAVTLTKKQNKAPKPRGKLKESFVYFPFDVTSLMMSAKKQPIYAALESKSQGQENCTRKCVAKLGTCRIPSHLHTEFTFHKRNQIIREGIQYLVTIIINKNITVKLAHRPTGRTNNNKVPAYV